MSLRLYGVMMLDGHTPAKIPAGLNTQPLRDLAAITEEGDFRAGDVDTADIERHLTIVSGLFRTDPVLPAPVGTVQLDGALWRARMWELEEEGAPLAEGSAVVVESIDGLTLTVRPAEEWEVR